MVSPSPSWRLLAAFGLCLARSLPLGAQVPDPLPEPGFTSPGGLFTGSSLALGFSGPGAVRYTLDGSEPDDESPLWSGRPLILSDPDPNDGFPGGIVVTARLEKAGRWGPSAVRSFLFYPPGTPGPGRLAVVSLAGRPSQLVDGPDGLLGRTHDLYDGTEVPVHGDFFEGPDRAPSYSVRCGARLFGGASREFNAQKSLTLSARSRYGFPRFLFPFFPGLADDRGQPLASFDALVLRSGGNDGGSTLLRDALMANLMEGTTVDHQAYRPVVVFANGRYWGCYQLREKVSTDFLVSHHPMVKGKALDFLADFGQVIAGAPGNFHDLMAWLADQNPEDSDFCTRLSSWVDLEQFTDYQVAQIYDANTDWPGNNIKYWRAPAAGFPWRWVLYDTDFGFGLMSSWSTDTLSWALSADGAPATCPPESTLLFRRLMENPGYRGRFWARFQELLATRFSPGAVVARIDALAAEVRDEVLTRHWNRWNLPGLAEGYPGPTAWDAQVDVLREFARNRANYFQDLVPGYFDHPPPVRHHGTGLRAEYFRGTLDLGGDPFVVRTDPRIDLRVEDGEEEPVPGLGTESFSVRWSGKLRSSFEGPVTLILTGDDGHRLSLDGTILIDEWYGQAATAHTVTVTLESGRSYDLVVEYFQGTGRGEVRLEWSQGLVREVIPATQLDPAE